MTHLLDTNIGSAHMRYTGTPHSHIRRMKEETAT
jgi:hypothetical protein